MVTIHISSLEAIERLIGDDRQMEITLRRSLVNAFAKSFVANHHGDMAEVIKRIHDDAVEAVREEAKSAFGDVYVRHDKWSDDVHHIVELAPHIHEEIHLQAKEQVQAVLGNLIRQEVRKIDIREIVASVVADQVKAVAENLAKEQAGKFVREAMVKGLMRGL